MPLSFNARRVSRRAEPNLPAGSGAQNLTSLTKPAMKLLLDASVIRLDLV
jgi:hypothetical protein